MAYLPVLPAHVLPRGFHHIRRFGFLGPRVATVKLERTRELLGVPAPESIEPDEVRRDEPEPQDDEGPNKPRPCRYCGIGMMHLIAETPRPTVADIMRMPTSMEIRADEGPVQMHLPLTAFT